MESADGKLWIFPKAQSRANGLQHREAGYSLSHHPIHSQRARGSSSFVTASDSAHRDPSVPNLWQLPRYNNHYRHIRWCACLHGRCHRGYNRISDTPGCHLVRASRGLPQDPPQHPSAWPREHSRNQSSLQTPHSSLLVQHLSQRHRQSRPQHSNRPGFCRCSRHCGHRAYSPRACRYSAASSQSLPLAFHRAR